MDYNAVLELQRLCSSEPLPQIRTPGDTGASVGQRTLLQIAHGISHSTITIFEFLYLFVQLYPKMNVEINSFNNSKDDKAISSETVFYRQLQPPMRFGLVNSNVYRGAYPTINNFKYLHHMKLKVMIHTLRSTLCMSVLQASPSI